MKTHTTGYSRTGWKASKWVKHNGEEYTIVEFASQYLTCAASTVYKRLRQNWSIKQIVEKYGKDN